MNRAKPYSSHMLQHPDIHSTSITMESPAMHQITFMEWNQVNMVCSLQGIRTRFTPQCIEHGSAINLGHLYSGIRPFNFVSPNLHVCYIGFMYSKKWHTQRFLDRKSYQVWINQVNFYVSSHAINTFYMYKWNGAPRRNTKVCQIC